MRIFILLIYCMFSAAAVHAGCKTDIPVSTPDKDFADGPEGVTVANSGLMWKKCIEGLSGDKCEDGSPSLFTWQEALQQPGKVNEAGAATYKDWRLPTLKELLTLVERQCQAPAINPNHFPNTPSSAVWSQTPYADAPDAARGSSISTMAFHSSTTAAAACRCGWCATNRSGNSIACTLVTQLRTSSCYSILIFC